MNIMAVHCQLLPLWGDQDLNLDLSSWACRLDVGYHVSLCR